MSSLPMCNSPMPANAPTLRELQAGWGSVLRGQTTQALLLQRDNNARLNLYCGNNQETLLQTLEKMYPLSQRLIGQVDFRQLCIGFIRQTPPKRRNLHSYTLFEHDFIDYLANANKTLGLVGTGLLVEFAEYEATRYRCYYSANTNAWDQMGFQALSVEQQMTVQLKLAPSLSWHSFSFDLLALIKQLQDEPFTLSETIIAHKKSEHCCLVIERRFYQDGTPRVTSRRISADTFNALNAAQQSTPLSTLMQNHTSLANGTDALPHWIEHGWICGWQLPTTELNDA